MEHMTPEGLRHGYYCMRCGESCGMYGHTNCTPNPDRVAILQELNKP